MAETQKCNHHLTLASEGTDQFPLPHLVEVIMNIHISFLTDACSGLVSSSLSARPFLQWF